VYDLYLVVKVVAAAFGGQYCSVALQLSSTVFLYLLFCFFSFILRYGSVPVRKSEQDTFVSRLSLGYFSVNHLIAK